ncbi:MAG: DNA repair protein RecN [Desulfatiglandales bacterium]
MLVQLTISDFAIISHLEIHFDPGFNILSGETGAGKSIIINAVNLILGERAHGDLLRSGSEEARIEALFQFPNEHPIAQVLSDFGIPYSGDVLIKRVISREGRNRIFVNGSIATLQMLARIGTMLISISGQHEHQSLLRPENHLHILDEFGALTDERRAFNEEFSRYKSLEDEGLALAETIRRDEEKQELNRFQLEEIERASIREGEDGDLEEERKRLRHAEQLENAVGAACHRLYERDESVVSNLSLCIRELERGAEIDKGLCPVIEAVTSVKVELEEAVLDLRTFQQRIVNDPYRLEKVDERLQTLNRLKKKYGPTLEAVLRFKDQLSISSDSLSQKKEDLEKLTQKISEMEARLLRRAMTLSGERKRAARELEAAVERELMLLAMGRTRFAVRFEGEANGRNGEKTAGMEALKPDGMDRVEFMLSTNVGEDVKSLFKIASGGELSRIMLALKTILARTSSVETVVFDEVDAGIGGATAEVVGEKLQSLAKFHQLLCISHLHQIASKGGTHFLVEKKVRDHRTQTTIRQLDPEQRVQEIARMLGGKRISPQVMAHARELLG